MHQAIFVCVSWPSLLAWRQSIGLSPIDPHITIGFHQNDIHDQRKGPDTIFKTLSGDQA